jgi:predicted nucleotidyltransferase
MPSNEIQAAFQEFERERVRVPKAEIEAAKSVHPVVTGFYEQELKAVERAKLVGSFARRTQAAHLKDIDELIVIDDPDGWWRASAGRALSRVAEVAVRCPLIYDAEPRVRAVRLRLRDYPFFIDIVPAIKPANGSGLLLARRQPDEGLDDWTLENPEGQLLAATTKNLTCAGGYVPAVRIIKFWNQTPSLVPRGSHHVACIGGAHGLRQRGSGLLPGGGQSIGAWSARARSGQPFEVCG